MNILITGSNGFIASKFAEFAKGEEINVFGIGRKRKNNYSKDYIKNIKGSLNYNTLKRFKEKFDYIYHCAGSGVVNNKKKDAINISSSENLLKFIAKYSPNTKIIFTSSASVYGNNKKIFTEKTKLNPISNYGKKKYLIEKKMLQYSKKYGINILILRITSVYGEGIKKQFFFDCCSKIKRNKNEFFGAGDEKRDWLHIKDLNKLIFNIINKGFVNFNIYNCGTGKGHKIRKVIKYIIKKNNKKMIPRFNRKGLDQNPKSNIVNIKKLKKFNWKPKMNFWNGVSNYVEWFNRNF